jgi:hypothetical protein
LIRILSVLGSTPPVKQIGSGRARRASLGLQISDYHHLPLLATAKINAPITIVVGT